MLTNNKISTISLPLLFAVVFLLVVSGNARPLDDKAIRFNGNDLKIVISDKEPGPIKLALKALLKDFTSVMGTEPAVVNEMSADNSQTEIVIINRSSGTLAVPSDKVRELDGFESHRIYADAENNRIYLEGYDLRGTIYAIYTFSEKILGVPPLHFYSTWIPDKKR